MSVARGLSEPIEAFPSHDHGLARREPDRVALLLRKKGLAHEHGINGLSDVDDHDADPCSQLVARLTHRAKSKVRATFGGFARKQFLHRGPDSEVSGFDLEDQELTALIPSERPARRDRAINSSADFTDEFRLSLLEGFVISRTN